MEKNENAGIKKSCQICKHEWKIEVVEKPSICKFSDSDLESGNLPIWLTHPLTIPLKLCYSIYVSYLQLNPQREVNHAT